jgi:hypothetical protein
MTTSAARLPVRDARVPSRIGSTSRLGGTPRIVSLLDVEPELGRGIESQDWEAARQAARATLTRVARRDCALLAGAHETGTAVGLIVHSGMISREMALGPHVCSNYSPPATYYRSRPVAQTIWTWVAASP